MFSPPACMLVCGFACVPVPTLCYPDVPPGVYMCAINKVMSHLPVAPWIPFNFQPLKTLLSWFWHTRWDMPLWITAPSSPASEGVMQEMWPKYIVWYSVTVILASWAPLCKLGQVDGTLASLEVTCWVLEDSMLGKAYVRVRIGSWLSWWLKAAAGETLWWEPTWPMGDLSLWFLLEPSIVSG